MSIQERAVHLALMVLKQITAPAMTVTPEQFRALTQEVRDTCAEAGLDVVSLYHYVVSTNREIENAIRFGGLREQQAGACLRVH